MKRAIPVYVNSANRQAGTVSDFYIDTAVPGITDTENEVSLHYVNYRNSWYTVNQYNSQIQVVETDTAGPTSSTVNISLPQKNYSVFTLRDQLATSLNGASVKGVTYSVTYDTDTGKYTISTVTASRTFNIHFENDLSPYLTLGFNKLQTGDLTSTTSDKVAILTGPLDMVLLVYGFNHSVIAGDEQFSTVLVTVPVDVDFGHMAYYRPDIDNYRFRIRNFHSTDLRVRVMQDWGHGLVNAPINSDWSVAFTSYEQIGE